MSELISQTSDWKPIFHEPAYEQGELWFAKGPMGVDLSKQVDQRRLHGSRSVAKAVVDNPDLKIVVNEISGGITDEQFENLKWAIKLNALGGKVPDLSWTRPEYKNNRRKSLPIKRGEFHEGQILLINDPNELFPEDKSKKRFAEGRIILAPVGLIVYPFEALEWGNQKTPLMGLVIQRSCVTLGKSTSVIAKRTGGLLDSYAGDTRRQWSENALAVLGIYQKEREIAAWLRHAQKYMAMTQPFEGKIPGLPGV